MTMRQTASPPPILPEAYGLPVSLIDRLTSVNLILSRLVFLPGGG